MPSASAAMAHAAGAKVLIDGAQWVAHAPTDVREIDGCDFYVFSGAQAVRADGDGGVVRPKREGAGGDAAVPGRRRHGRDGHVRADDVRATCRTSSRPARPTSRGPSAWRRPSSTSSASASRPSCRSRAQRCWPTPPSSWRPVPGLRLVGTAPARRSVRLVRDRRPADRRRTTSASPWTATASPSAPVTTAASRSWTAWASRPRPGRRWRCTTRGRRRRARRRPAQAGRDR